jgi:hypothetical protein
MSSRFLGLFAAPRFPDDEEKTRRARLFHVCFLFSSAWLILVLLGNLAGGRMPGVFNAVIVGVMLLGLVPYWMVRNGHLEFGASLWLALAFLSAVMGVSLLGTVRAPSIGYFLVLVLCSGFVFDGRAMWVMILLSSLAVAGLIAAEKLGWIYPVDLRVGVTQWVTATSLFATVGGLTFVATRQISASLQRAQAEVEERRRTEAELRETNRRLEDALNSEKTLKGLLPICAWCRKVREDEGYWSALENYVSAHTGTTFTHGICPDCQARHFPRCDKVR